MNMTYDEISRKTGLARGTVITIEQRALAKLRLAMRRLALREDEDYTRAADVVEPAHPVSGCRRVPARIPFEKGDDAND